MPRSRVVVVSATPETIQEDYQRLLRLAGLGETVGTSRSAVLLLDLPWDRFQPAVGPPPWELEGVLEGLYRAGMNAESITVLARAFAGKRVSRAASRYRLDRLLKERSLAVHSLPSVSRPHVPNQRRPVLETWMEGRIDVPELSSGKDMLLLSTLKTHSALGLGGAVAAAATELLDLEASRHRRRFVEAVAEALAISLELHPHHLAVIDATSCGLGPGPYRVRPHVQNLLLASTDPVAVDAVGARLLGFEPRRMPLLSLCRELGLGAVEESEIEIVGEHPDLLDSSVHPLRREGWSAPGIPSGASLITLRRWLHRVGRNTIWYPWAGRRWRRLWRKTPWGMLFNSYGARGDQA